MASLPSILLGSASTSRALVLRAACVPFTQASADIDEKEASLRAVDASSSIPALYQVPARIARAKAGALLSHASTGASSLLVCADQVVADDDDVIHEKPASRAEAMAMLTAYSGRSARCISSVHVVNVATGAAATGVEVATVHYSESLAAAVQRAGDAALQASPPVPHASLPFTHAASASLLLSHDMSTWEAAPPVARDVELRPSASSAGDVADPMRCAGGVCMEHPFSSGFITRIDGSWDSVLGLPWALTRTLMARVA